MVQATIIYKIHQCDYFLCFQKVAQNLLSFDLATFCSIKTNHLRLKKVGKAVKFRHIWSETNILSSYNYRIMLLLQKTDYRDLLESES